MFYLRTVDKVSAPTVCRYYMLVQQKEKWEEQEGRGRKEKEELNQQIQKNRLLQQENLQLKSERDRYCMSTHPPPSGSCTVCVQCAQGQDYSQLLSYFPTTRVNHLAL